MDKGKNLVELLRSVEEFSGSDERTLEELAGLFQPMELKVGDTFIRKGDIDNRLFILSSGSVRVHDGEVIVAFLHSGKMIGELALIDDGPRSLSATAEEDMLVYFIRRDDFIRMMTEHMDITLATMKLTVGRYRALNSDLQRRIDDKTRDLNEKNKELLRSQQFKERFLANMSHEIRTPMNAIIGMTNLLRKGKVFEEQKSYLKNIKDASENLRVIIDDILDLSKLEAGKVEIEQIPLRIREVVGLVQDILKFKADEKQLDFAVNVDDRIPEVVLGDPTRLNQILVNLAGNAIKFTEKGSVEIFLKGLDAGDSLCVTFLVRDTGIGMSPEQQRKIFEPFAQASSQTTRKFGGTGLGLSISLQLVELMAGELALTSEPGVGSDFSFTIPMAETSMAETDEAEGPRDLAADLKGIRILLVEDDPFNVVVATDSIEMEIEKVKVEVAENGQEAVEKLKKEEFDIVLMDYHLPVMNGIEATRHIRTKLDEPMKSVPIIAMTAAVTREEIRNCYDAGMDDVLTKPFETDDLVVKLAGALKLRRAKERGT